MIRPIEGTDPSTRTRNSWSTTRESESSELLTRTCARVSSHVASRIYDHDVYTHTPTILVASPFSFPFCYTSRLLLDSLSFLFFLFLSFPFLPSSFLSFPFIFFFLSISSLFLSLSLYIGNISRCRRYLDGWTKMTREEDEPRDGR